MKNPKWSLVRIDEIFNKLLEMKFLLETGQERITKKEYNDLLKAFNESEKLLLKALDKYKKEDRNETKNFRKK